MKARRHLVLLSQGVGVWLAFWLAGSPAYYQQYSQLALALACVFLSVAISLCALLVLRRGTRMRRAFWFSIYYTLPFALLDALYCGWYLGHGEAFVYRYWYLAIFYITPWLTFIPTAFLLNGGERGAAERV